MFGELPVSDPHLPAGAAGIERHEAVEHRCPQCAHEWTAAMFQELGAMFYFADFDGICPVCGTEGVAV